MQSGITIEILKTLNNCAKYEIQLHKIFKNEKFAGEWFCLNEIQLSWLLELNETNIEFQIDYILKNEKITKEYFDRINKSKEKFIYEK